MEVGFVCIKTKGRDAGKRVVVLTTPKKGRVIIDGIDVKRKECNVLHLFPLGQKVNAKESTTHEEIVKALGKL